jgi:uncharacterized membrane protein
MPAVWIAALWIAFAATHMGMSSLRHRPGLVAALGERGFQAVYSLVALGIFVPLVWTYFAHQHAGPFLWYVGHVTAVRWLGYLGMTAALVLVLGGLFQRSPASMNPGSGEVKGALRITRHPVFMGLGLYGLTHLIVANTSASELAFFLGFPVFAWIGSQHQDERKLVTAGESYRRFVDATPFAPFSRRGGLRGLREMPIPLGLGIAAAVGLRYVHPSWFGGAP